jgi:hypothetical protein
MGKQAEREISAGFRNLNKGEQHDEVNHPARYTRGKVECIDAIESAVFGKSPVEAVSVAAIIKYLWRYEEKGGHQDLEKATWYLERLKQVVRGA